MKMHEKLIVVDGHSDYPLQILRERLKGKTHIIENQHLPRLRAGGIKLEVATVGADVVLDNLDFREPQNVLRVFDCIYKEIEESSGSIRLVLEKNDLNDLEDEGKLFMLLNLEGAASIGEDLSLLHNFYRLGLRSLSLTHNERNILADGCGEDSYSGLSKHGKALIKEVNKLSIMVDLVHINERGFFDVLELIEKPVVVSHSNVRKLCDCFRNLTDEQIKAVAERGGVVGLNFLCFMVDEDLNKATLERLLDHVDYIAQLCGIEHVGLGPDFTDYFKELFEAYLEQHGLPLDITKYVEGASDATGMLKIGEGLSTRGYKDSEIKKVMGENFLRVYKQVLP